MIAVDSGMKGVAAGMDDAFCFIETKLADTGCSSTTSAAAARSVDFTRLLVVLDVAALTDVLTFALASALISAAALGVPTPVSVS